jgi:hypothetical protein
MGRSDARARSVEILTRRMKHLRKRIDSGPPFSKNWDEAEFEALKWVLTEIGALDDEEIKTAVGE